MGKSLYLNEAQEESLDRIRPYFVEIKIEPSDSMIVSAALRVYEEYLKAKRDKEKED